MSRERFPLVYVAGPITKGRPTVMHNVAAATEVFELLAARGVLCYCPQWSVLVAHALPKLDYEAWMRLDFELVRRCDALVRLPGESTGADREVALAHELRLPVFFWGVLDPAVTADHVRDYLRRP